MKKMLIICAVLIFTAGNVWGQVITVGPGGSYNHTTIQAAINAAISGDVITVAAGTYPEDNSNNAALLVTKSITIIGTGLPVVDGVGTHDRVIEIQSDNVSIIGMKFTNSSSIGMLFFGVGGSYSCDNALIENCEITNNDIGIELAEASNAVIKNNTITGNTFRGIIIQQDSDNNEVKGNTIIMTGGDVENAIYIGSNSGGNTIGGSNVSDGNTINIPSNQTNQAHLPYAIQFSTGGANDATIQNNTFTNIGARGVQIDGGNTGTYTISDNSFTSDLSNAINMHYAIGVNAGNVVVTGNTMNNTQRPFECFGAGTVTITGNTLSGTNFLGINLGSYTGNPVVTGNAFLGFGGNGNVVWNQGTGAVDATGNWWGDLDPSDNVNNSGGGSLDYTPWWGANYVGDAHATAWTWYTNDSIQEAINAALSGDVINVAAGTYNEALTITKSLTLNGAKAGIDARNRNTSSGESILDGAGFSSAEYSLIKIDNGVSDVVIDGFEFRNMIFSSTGGGNAISSYSRGSSTTGANNITIQNNYMHDLGYNGILVVSENNTGSSMIVQEGWVIQKNKIMSYRYAGIELTNVANSQVKDNDIAAPTELVDDPGDAGVGIEIAARSRMLPVTAGTDVVVSGNKITGSFPAGSRAAINLLSRTYESVSNATLADVIVKENNISGATNVRAAVLAVSESRNGSPATISNLAITNNILDGNLNGIEFQDYVKSGSGSAMHTNNIVTGNDIKNNTNNGVHIMSSTDATGISVTTNKVVSNTLFGINNEGTGTLAATCNWWGDASGPSHITNPGGNGDDVSNNVTYLPWLVGPAPDGSCTGPDPCAALDKLMEDLEGMGIHKGMENSLNAKLKMAKKSCGEGKSKTASNQLQSFINSCEAQSGKKLTVEQADDLIAQAESIIEGFNNVSPSIKTSDNDNSLANIEEFTLIQNHPNPFNPTTLISYNLPKASQVTMTVYDMMGKQVKSLVQEFQPAGNHSVIWNATNDNGTRMSGGMYFYQIRAGSFQQTHKMILLK